MQNNNIYQILYELSIKSQQYNKDNEKNKDKKKSKENKENKDNKCALCQLNWPGHSDYEIHHPDILGTCFQVYVKFNYDIKKKVIKIKLPKGMKQVLKQMEKDSTYFFNQLLDKIIIVDIEMNKKIKNENISINTSINTGKNKEINIFSSKPGYKDIVGNCEAFGKQQMITQYGKIQSNITVPNGESYYNFDILEGKYSSEYVINQCKQRTIAVMIQEFGKEYVDQCYQMLQEQSYQEIEEEEKQQIQQTQQIQNIPKLQITGTLQEQKNKVLELLKKMKQTDVQPQIQKGGMSDLIALKNKQKQNIFDIKINGINSLLHGDKEEQKENFMSFIKQSWAQFNLPEGSYFIKFIDNKKKKGQLLDFVVVNFKPNYYGSVHLIMDQYEKQNLQLNYEGIYITYEKVQVKEKKYLI